MEQIDEEEKNDEKIAQGKCVSLFVSVGWISSLFFWISFQILFDFFRNSK